MPNGVSVPSDFPHIKVTTNKATANGYIFLNNWREQNPYNIIFDNDGSPVWYARRDDADRRWDFKVQENGRITMLKRPGGLKFLSYDENFTSMNEHAASAGYATDEHELIMLENGHYLLLGTRAVKVDMSQFVEDAFTDVIVHENTIQEFTANHQLIFNWSALENLSDGLPYCHDYHRKVTEFSYPHMNAIDVDDDGHILLSNRNLDEVTKINRQTGQILWRLGGVHNQFTFVNDSLNGFNWQHDIRSLGGGYYSLFDNGREHHPSQSRAVIYKLNTKRMTATLVWEHRNPKFTDISLYMGNVQKLPNGNMLINWGVNYRPKATEVTPSGEVVYEMNFMDGYACYRTFRFPWHGKVEAPYLIIESKYNYVTLIFNKFGDVNVDHYRIYADVNPNPTTLLDTCRTTLKFIHNLENRRTFYFRVSAVLKDGIESPLSVEKTGIKLTKSPDGNMIINGDFSKGQDQWSLGVSETATATLETSSKEAHVIIASANTIPESIVLSQEKLFLANYEEYILQFDAWASAPRTINALVSSVKDPEIDFATIESIPLGRGKRNYRYQFVVSGNTVLDAKLSFLLGANSEDVHLDNIKLFQKVATDAHTKYSFHSTQMNLQNYPNPFNCATSIRYTLIQPGHVKASVYNLSGQLVRIVVDEEQNAGVHMRSWEATNGDGNRVSAGIYLCRIEFYDHTGREVWREERKMLLLK